MFFESAPTSKAPWLGYVIAVLAFFIAGCPCPLSAQQSGSGPPASGAAEPDLRKRVGDLENEVEQLKAELREMKDAIASSSSSGDSGSAGSVANIQASPAQQAVPQQGTAGQQLATATPRSKTITTFADYLRGTTLNVGFDGYYEYNFNTPIGRVNLLRAYDVLSNNISLNQASLIVEHAPDLAAGYRAGVRLDLQYGQATDTLQGNPSNEPRPDVYRNVFQAYGTYIVPLGSGLNVDVGKWGSSIGLEGNYTKDQMNYSRSFWFNFLPFYHMGVRANYKVNDRLGVNYWIVNGTNQAEATNGFKDELFGLVLQSRKNVSWTVNYYLGQEHPDRIVVPPAGLPSVQPGLNFAPIRPAPDGRTHIFDSYVTWQATSRLATALEGDYFIQREWKRAAPGRSAAPSHVVGGALYAQYRFTPRNAIAGRAEYLYDRDGLFSGVTQALKETTATYDFKIADGFLIRYEWRRDFSNRPYFFTHVPGILKKDQNTLGIGLVWWFGGKEGAW